jgi:hypothetical protein
MANLDPVIEHDGSGTRIEHDPRLDLRSERYHVPRVAQYEHAGRRLAAPAECATVFE